MAPDTATYSLDFALTTSIGGISKLKGFSRESDLTMTELGYSYVPSSSDLGPFGLSLHASGTSSTTAAVPLDSSRFMGAVMTIRLIALIVCVFAAGIFAMSIVLDPQLRLLLLSMFFPCVGTAISMALILRKGSKYDGS